MRSSIVVRKPPPGITVRFVGAPRGRQAPRDQKATGNFDPRLVATPLSRPSQPVRKPPVIHPSSLNHSTPQLKIKVEDKQHKSLLADVSPSLNESIDLQGIDQDNVSHEVTHSHPSPSAEKVDQSQSLSEGTVVSAAGGSLEPAESAMSPNRPIESNPTINNSRMSALRKSLHGLGASKAITSKDIRSAVKERKLFPSLLSSLSMMTQGDIKTLLRGIDLNSVSSLIDTIPPSEDGSLRDHLSWFSSAVNSKKVDDMSVKEDSSIDHLEAISLIHVRELLIEKENYFLTINGEIFVDPLSIVECMYSLYGKTNRRNFLREYLKHILKHLLLPSQYKYVYLAHNHKLSEGGFVIPAQIVETLTNQPPTIQHSCYSR
ncbi:hypothetical protein PENTCL1PPCAC_20002 [Pristionchus entomophagus]|uniref:Uncharacterized protein n=1 Tax=Pristionchus entomophagus TaxID=358040 RepID=A0AAV5TTQ3_9BILA|nr:hypothetical protein PENTCL1PPCAC_20002 [Pristionchus entomophagus]